MVCFCGVKEHFMFYIVTIQSTGESLLFLVIASMANNCKRENAKRMAGSRIAYYRHLIFWDSHSIVGVHAKACHI